MTAPVARQAPSVPWSHPFRCAAAALRRERRRPRSAGGSGRLVGSARIERVALALRQANVLCDAPSRRPQLPGRSCGSSTRMGDQREGSLPAPRYSPTPQVEVFEDLSMGGEETNNMIIAVATFSSSSPCSHFMVCLRQLPKKNRNRRTYLKQAYLPKSKQALLQMNKQAYLQMSKQAYLPKTSRNTKKLRRPPRKRQWMRTSREIKPEPTHVIFRTSGCLFIATRNWQMD